MVIFAMEKNEVVAHWLDSAKDDIDSANIMYNAGKYMYTGFMLQQSIEKALKAVISSTDVLTT